MDHLLLEDYKTKRIKILNNPQFENFWIEYTSQIFRGAAFTRQELVNTIARKFDPTAKSVSIINEPQANGTTKEIISGDSKYLDFIFDNLFSGNISLSDAEEVYDTLEAYRVQTARNNPNISKEIQTFKVFNEDPNVKDRQGGVLPGMFKVMKSFIVAYDFRDNRFSNLVETETFMSDNDFKMVYETTEHKFYLVENLARGKIALGNINDPDFKLSGKNKRCSGYWCLPNLGSDSYYPVWLAMDVYGFFDYAIVPKSGEWGLGEIKNRFNAPTSCLSMEEKDYGSIYDFIANYNGEFSSMLADRFKSFKALLSSIFVPAADNKRASSITGDFHQFLLRSKNLNIFNNLAQTDYTSVFQVIMKACGVNSSGKMMKRSDYELLISIANQAIVSAFKKFPRNLSNFPLIKSLAVSRQDLLTGEFSYESYAASYIPQLIASFKQSFTQDTDLLANDGIGFKDLAKFIYSSLPIIKEVNTTVGDKIDKQIASLIEQDRLYFESKIELSALSYIATLISTVPAENHTAITSSAAYKALMESFITYLNIGGLLNWTDVMGEAIFDTASHEKLVMLASGASESTKKKFFNALFSGNINNNMRRLPQSFRFTTIVDLYLSAKKLNISFEDGVGNAFKMLNNVIGTSTKASVVDAIASIHQLKYYDDIISDIVKHYKYIIKNSPFVAQILASMLPKSVFNKQYPNIAKFNAVRRHVVTAKRLQAVNSLIQQSPDGYIKRNEDDARLLPDPDSEALLSDLYTLKVPATSQNLQSCYDVFNRSFSESKFFNFMGSITLLMSNENFIPQHFYIYMRDFYGDTTSDSRIETIRRLTGSTRFNGYDGLKMAVIGKIGDKKIAVDDNGVIIFTKPNDELYSSADSYGDYEQQQREQMFERYSHKKPAKNTFAFLIEKIRI